MRWFLVTMSSTYSRNGDPSEKRAMSDNRQMVLGTYNQKKRGELQRLLLPLNIELKTLEEFPEVVEDGSSFAENAAKKATQQAVALGQWVLAEDSGLCVDALKGAPGIYSARFSGDDATDEKNNDLLLEKLEGLPPEKRGAHYVCHIVLSNPQGEVVLEAEDKCHGRIVTERRGTNGFGYDPLFELREYHRTFGEMGPAIKGLISHRAKASRAFVHELGMMLAKNPALLAIGSVKK
ncbi:RdgB/HAM1 family non-canonical purine NTP pyrophosphatase [Bremerella volcania]|nr:RdgB/HAM1 family non-canonical purine NTP pyrophosphatase [Bremerella volcania]